MKHNNHSLKRAIVVRFFLFLAGLVCQVVPIIDIRALGLTLMVSAALSTSLLSVDLKSKLAILIIFIAQGLGLVLVVLWNQIQGDQVMYELNIYGLIALGFSLMMVLDRYFSAVRTTRRRTINPP